MSREDGDSDGMSREQKAENGDSERKLGEDGDSYGMRVVPRRWCFPGERSGGSTVTVELQPEENGDGEGVVPEMLPRPRTVPELLVKKKTDVMSSTELGVAHGRPKLTNLLLHVMMQRSLGAVYVLMSPDVTVMT
ncbi:putative protein-like [Forsythia ovata]|uniref:Uncharacterized protein n=1 Tax=Forsythia ovata TaxID=205694 RepID=A0ABD1WJR0_9LAMI